MCETVSIYGGQRQCEYCQLMMGNGPITTMNGHSGLMKNSFTSHTIDNCNGIKGNAMSHVWHTTTQLSHLKRRPKRLIATNRIL